MNRNEAHFPAKVPVLGIPISLTSYDEILDVLARRPRHTATVVSVCNVHSIMEARRDPQLRAAIERSDVATPDGMPIVWVLRGTARPGQTRVYGPDLMSEALHSSSHGFRHFLFGSSEETLGRLQSAIQRDAPQADVVGAVSPPFRDLTPHEEADVVAQIKGSGADIVWVGLGMPKQELWMDHIRSKVPGVALVGVGAAFDFLAGTKPQAPQWMQRSGLEWLFRLITEPRRLWKRYLINNPAFVALVVKELPMHARRRRSGDEIL